MRWKQVWKTIVKLYIYNFLIVLFMHTLALMRSIWPVQIFSYLNWPEVCDVSCDEFFSFSFIVVWSTKQLKIYRIVIFDQITCFTVKNKFLKFDPGKTFMDKLVKLSRKPKGRRKNWLRFLIAVILYYI